MKIRYAHVLGVVALVLVSTVLSDEAVKARNPLPPPGLASFPGSSFGRGGLEEQQYPTVDTNIAVHLEPKSKVGHIIIASNDGEVEYMPTEPSNYHSMITTGMISDLLVNFFGEGREVVEEFVVNKFGLNFTTLTDGEDYELQQYRMKHSNNVRAYLATSPCTTPREGYPVHEYGWLFRVSNPLGIASVSLETFYPYNTAFLYSWLIVNTGNTTCPTASGLEYPQPLRFRMQSNVPLYLQTNPSGPLLFDMTVQGLNTTAGFFKSGQLIGAINPLLNGQRLKTTTIHYLMFKESTE